MLEPRFNLDTLAMLLNIPPQKTLLRRHLATNFNNLVGAQAQQEKWEYTQAAGYAPLSITAKVKVRKHKPAMRGTLEPGCVHTSAATQEQSQLHHLKTEPAASTTALLIKKTE